MHRSDTVGQVTSYGLGTGGVTAPKWLDYIDTASISASTEIIGLVAAASGLALIWVRLYIDIVRARRLKKNKAEV